MLLELVLHKELLEDVGGAEGAQGGIVQAVVADDDVEHAVAFLAVEAEDAVRFQNPPVVFEERGAGQPFLPLALPFKGEKGGANYQGIIPLQSRRQEFKEMRGTAQSSVLIGKSTIDLHHPDYHQLRVLVTLLGGYFGSRLMTTVREEKGLTYGIYALLNPSPYDNTLMILSDCDPKFVQPLLAETYHQIDILQNELVGAEELMLVRNSMKGELLRSYDSCLSLSDVWIYLHTLALPDDYFHQFWQTINTITASDLQRLACVYLNKDTLTEVVAGEKMS